MYEGVNYVEYTCCKDAAIGGDITGEKCGDYAGQCDEKTGSERRYCPDYEAPCFSRDAEACRVLDPAASPADAFRACFDDPALKTAERVRMAELAAGEYVLSAGKDLTYEFARVIVNQHRIEGQARPPPPTRTQQKTQKFFFGTYIC